MKTMTWEEFTAQDGEPSTAAPKSLSFEEFAAAGAETKPLSWDEFANASAGASPVKFADPDPNGDTIGAASMEQIAAGQRRMIREKLSPIIGYTPEQQQYRLEGAQRGILDGRPAFTVPRIGKQQGTVSQVGAGIYNAGAGLVEGLANPGLLIAGMSPIGPVAQAVSGYFATDMAAHVPGGIQATVDAAKQGDLQQAVEAGAGTVASAVMAGSAGKHAMGEFPHINRGKELSRQLDKEIADTVDWEEFKSGTPASAGASVKFVDPKEREQIASEIIPEVKTIADSPLDFPKPYVIDPSQANWINRAAAQARGESIADLPQETIKPTQIEGGELQNEAQKQWQEVLVEPSAIRKTVGQDAIAEVPQPSTKAPAQETITGSNERTVSEMPAEREERPAPAPGQLSEVPPTETRKSKYARADADRPHDIIDEIESFAGKFNPKLIEEAAPGWKPPGIIRKFFSRNGIPADVVISGLQKQGLLGSKLDGSIDGFREAIEAAAKSRAQWRKKFYSDERRLNALGSQAAQFEKKVILGERPKKEAGTVERIAVDDLMPGDQFTVQNHKFEVKDLEFDEDGRTTSITVKDGPKFGVQRLYLDQPGVGTLHIDQGSVVRKPASENQTSPGQSADSGFFDKPESIEEQRAREQSLADQQARRDQQEEIRRRQAAPLEGTRGDIGQGKLFEEDKTELFSPGSKGSHADPPRSYPGGPLGTTADPHNSASFSVFPAELPEAVEFAKQLLGGKYPKVVETIRTLRGKALGVFRAKGPNAEIELRASIAELLTEADKRQLRETAMQYAKESGATTEKEVNAAFRAILETLTEQALEKAKRQNPEIALKVVWHEIGHLVDWLPDKEINGRGNLFGHIAALKRYFRNTLPLDSSTPDRPITSAERGKLYREAEKQMAEEVGPMQELVRKIIVEEPVFEQLKITPEDVKEMLGMEAREKFPDLYEWFAKQDGKVKAEILKKAMRGMLDERLGNVSGKTKTGTRKVERTVRETVGRPPTREEIQKRFEELFQKEMRDRRMVQLETVKAELEPLIAWWRGTEKMEKYFSTGPEMYAEAFSVFMNNPAAMAARAPTSWALFRGWMDRRPEVMAEYNRIQDSIAAGTVMRDRVMRLRESWSQDEARSVKVWWERKKTKATDVLDNVIYHYDREFGPVYRRASTHEAKEAIGNYLYRAAEHELFLARVNTRVGGILKAAALDFHWLGEFMYHKRVVEERHSMFNPLGWTPKNSLERLSEMERQLGPNRFGQLQEAAAQFREIYADQVIPLMKQARMWSDELQAKIDENVHYATFAAIRNIADSGIQREIDLTFGNSVTPHIYRQIGMLSEVKNPAKATVLKSLSLMTAAHRNITKRAIVEMMLRDSPTEIVPAEQRWTGKRFEPVIKESEAAGTIVFLEDGKVKGFYVPRAVAEAINKGPVMQNRVQAAVIGSLNHLKGVFTAYNIGFWAANFAKDSATFMLTMPGTATPWYWVKNLPRAIKAARASVKGDLSNPIAEQLLRRKMIVSRSDPRGVTSAAETEFDIKLASFGMDPVLWNGQLKPMQRLAEIWHGYGRDGQTLARSKETIKMLYKASASRRAKIWHGYMGIGQTLERSQKAIGMLYLDEKFPNMPEWEKQEIVRENAGSPDFLQRGASNATIDFFMLFYNPFKQGVRAVVNSAKRNPGQFGLKLSASISVPTLLMAFATKGYLGQNAQDKYASIPDYDLSNYLCLPIGWADEARKKVAYFRFPLPDALKVVHAGLFEYITGRGKGYTALMGGQLPGMNPIIDTLRAQGEYIMGQNPVDRHTGRPIIDSTTFQAGGWPAAEAMAKYSWNTLGGGLIHRFQNIALDNPPTTTTEEFLRAPLVANAIGRWIRISNRGVLDTDERNSKEIEQHRAQVRLAVRSLLNRWSESGILDGTAQNQQLGSLANMIARAELSEAERVLLREPYAMQYLGDTLPDVMNARRDFLLNRLQRMPSRESKYDLLRRERVGR